MSKKSKLSEQARRQSYDITTFAKKHFMRYIITILIAMPIIMLINYFLSSAIQGYNTLVIVFVTIALLLLSMLIATLICMRKDKRESLASKEDKRDPFAD